MKISEIVVDFSNAEIGSKVWAFVYGHGEIITKHEGRIVVYFYNRVTTSFRLDGKIKAEDKFPTLLPSEPEFTESPAKLSKDHGYIFVEGYVPVLQNKCKCGCGNAIVFDIEKETARSLLVRLRDEDWNIKECFTLNFSNFSLLSNKLHRMRDQIIANRRIPL